MPHRFALLSVPALVVLAGCAGAPDTSRTTSDLPDVPHDGLGVGLEAQEQAQHERETRLPDPERPDLPDVPTQRSLESWMEHASSTVVTDLDTILPRPGERTPIVRTEPDPVANETARLDADAIADDQRMRDLTPLMGGPADVFATVEEEPTIDAPPPGDVTQDLSTLLAALERMTGDEAMEAGLPLGPALKAGALEALTPGALERALGALDDDSPFTPDERTLLRAWADLHREVNLVDADPMQVARLLRSAADEASALLPMGVTRLELCTSVEGFGSFTPFFKQDDAVLIGAGRPKRMIVYAEIDRFGTKQMARQGVEGYEVDLSQTLELVHLDKGDGAADLIAWSHPSERITDFSRNRRRDFYTIQIIELPATLTIGRYHLRLTVTDAHTDEQAQAVIPINVVAVTSQE
ncbi:MAG: hypothetical protein Tsb0013_22520 [Phycisphaerales bacterium]